MSITAPVGLVLGSAVDPGQLRWLAAAAEDGGFAELWLSEDYFFTGGIAGAGVALGATGRIPVGIGVVSAVVRHPAVLAMELATLAHAHPGRLRPAIGLGVPGWLRQMGLMPRSPLTTMRQCVTRVRDLLDGERVDADAGGFGFHGVRLTHPPPERVPLHLGVAGAKMLRLAGEIADGTVLSVLAGDDYLRWARVQIAAGAASAGRDEPHLVTVFAICSVDADPAAARATIRRSVAFYLAAGGPNALTDAYGISDELAAMIAAGGAAAVEREMPERWIVDLTVSGTPDQCADRISGLLAAGADAVALFPPPERVRDGVQRIAAEVLPRVAMPSGGPR